jgi:hypothetical protein
MPESWRLPDFRQTQPPAFAHVKRTSMRQSLCVRRRSALGRLEGCGAVPSAGCNTNASCRSYGREVIAQDGARVSRRGQRPVGSSRDPHGGVLDRGESKGRTFHWRAGPIENFPSVSCREPGSDARTPAVFMRHSRNDICSSAHSWLCDRITRSSPPHPRCCRRSCCSFRLPVRCGRESRPHSHAVGSLARVMYESRTQLAGQ